MSLVIVLVITAIYIAYGNYQTRTDFNSARRLFAYWLLCDELQMGRELVGWDTGVRTRYERELGAIRFHRLEAAYEVSVRQPDGAFLAVPDVQQWTATVGSPLTLRHIYNMQEGEVYFIGGDALTLDGEEGSVGGLADVIMMLIWLVLGMTLDEGQHNPAEPFSNAHHALEQAKHNTLRSLRGYHRALGVDVGVAESPITAYKKLERAIYSSVAPVPSLNMAATPHVAVLAIAVLVLVLSIVVRARLDAVSQAERPWNKEPWLPLEALSTIPRVLARTWLFLFLGSSIVVYASYLAIVYWILSGGDIVGRLFWLQFVAASIVVVISAVNAGYTMTVINVISRKWHQREAVQ